MHPTVYREWRTRMKKQDSLKPADLAVALALAVRADAPTATYSQLGATLGLSASTIFQAAQRLQAAGLVRPGTREPNRTALLRFAEYGARHAFPPALGRVMRGVPTAHSGPPLRDLFDDTQAIVWPEADGPERGTALTPLYPNATRLPERAPEVYQALTLIDALRVGQARERAAALEALRTMLTPRSAEEREDA